MAYFVLMCTDFSSIFWAEMGPLSVLIAISTVTV